MSQSSDDIETESPGRYRFTIGKVLSATTLIALMLALVILQRDVRQLQSLGGVQKPFTANEVAARIENYASVHPLPVKVIDVQYSKASDSYQVWISFTDTTTQEKLKTKVTLNCKGYGAYVGCIKNDRFLAPLENKDGLWVGIEPNSSLKQSQ